MLRKFALLMSLALICAAAFTSTASAITITPAGDYTATGSGVMNTDTSSIDVVCTSVAIDGTMSQTGVSNDTTVAYTSCNATTIFKVSCTISSATMQTKAKTATGFTLTNNNAVVGTVNCIGVITCDVTAAVGALTITLTGGNPGSLALSGPVTTDGTALCTSVITGSGTITSPKPVTVTSA